MFTRAFGRNNSGTTSTPITAGVPKVSSESVIDFTDTTATINFMLDPNYGTNTFATVKITLDGETWDTTVLDTLTDTSAKSITHEFRELVPEGWYTISISCENDEGVGNEVFLEVSLLSSPPAAVVPEIIDQDTEYFAHALTFGLYTEVEPNGAETVVTLKYGYNTLDYDNDVILGSLTERGILTHIFPILKPGTYNWKVVTENSEGIVESGNNTFIVYSGIGRTLTEYNIPTMLGTTYYIDLDAVSPGTGTELSPFNDIPTNMGNSNTYLFKAGTEITRTTLIGEIGTCTLGSYGEGVNPIIRWNGTSTGIFIDATDATVIIRDIEIIKNDINGIIMYFANSPNSWVYNVTTNGSQWPVYTESATFSPTLQWSGLKVAYCNITNCGLDAVNARNVTNLEIAHCYFEDINMLFFVPGNEDQLLSSGDIVQVNSACRNPLNPTGPLVPCDIHIHHCYMNRESTGNKFAIIIDCATSTSNIHHNYMVGNRSFSGRVVNALYLNGYNNVHHNFIETFSNGLVVNTGITDFSYNIVNDTLTAVNIANNRTGNIYNNVFTNYLTRAITKMSGANMNSRNNIFKCSVAPYNINSGGTVVNDHNHFDGCTPSGTNYSSGDSKFTNASIMNFYPLPTSPVINTGGDVGLTTDFGDNIISAPFSKGVWE